MSKHRAKSIEQPKPLWLKTGIAVRWCYFKEKPGRAAQPSSSSSDNDEGEDKYTKYKLQIQNHIEYKYKIMLNTNTK